MKTILELLIVFTTGFAVITTAFGIINLIN